MHFQKTSQFGAQIFLPSPFLSFLFLNNYRFIRRCIRFSRNDTLMGLFVLLCLQFETLTHSLLLVSIPDSLFSLSGRSGIDLETASSDQGRGRAVGIGSRPFLRPLRPQTSGKPLYPSDFHLPGSRTGILLLRVPLKAG